MAVSQIKIIAPSRIYSAHPKGSFSTTQMIEYMSHIGFSGVDMSLEHINCIDDSWRSILYSAKKRAEEKGLDIPSCHLPFYMPDPTDAVAMARFSKDIKAGIDAAATMKIPLAVIHPIALHKVRASADTWARANMEFLKPLCDHAARRGIKLCIENMASNCEDGVDHLYGSSAQEIYALASALGTGICWDIGHANVSRRPLSDISELGSRLCLIHAHDNNGYRDSHELPFTGSVDWQGVCDMLSRIGYGGYISVEVRAWDVPPDTYTREDFGRKILYSGERIASLIRR